MSKLETGVTTSKEFGSKKPPMDLNDIEMVFGRPNSAENNVKPDVHTITNERRRRLATPLSASNGNSVRPEDVEVLPSTQPLLEPGVEKPKPPLAGPETDDLDDERERPNNNTPFYGNDDGLLEPGDTKTDHTNDGLEKSLFTTLRKSPASTRYSYQYLNNGDAAFFNPTTDDRDKMEGWESHHTHDEGISMHDRERASVDLYIPDYPNEINYRPTSTMHGSIPDVNTYQQKKNLAQGMMDLALLSANANQLRYVVESSQGHPYYYSSITFISLSIILQVAVGIGLIMNSRYNVKNEKDIYKANKINNMTVLGVFLVTIINVFITSFSVAPTNGALPPSG